MYLKLLSFYYWWVHKKNLKYFQVKMSFPYPNEKKFKNNKRSKVEIVIPLAKSNISLLKPLQIKNFKTFLWTHWMIVEWYCLYSTRDFELLKSCSTRILLVPNKRGLGVSKKVQYVSVAQWAVKQQLVKLEVIFHKVWRCTILQPFELQRCTAPFWKPPNSLYYEPIG